MGQIFHLLNELLDQDSIGEIDSYLGIDYLFRFRQSAVSQ